MQKVMILSLLATISGLWSMEQNEQDKKLLTVISNDKKEYVLDAQLAQRIPLLDHWVADMGDTPLDLKNHPWATGMIVEALIRIATICPLLEKIKNVDELKKLYGQQEAAMKKLGDGNAKNEDTNNNNNNRDENSVASDLNDLNELQKTIIDILDLPNHDEVEKIRIIIKKFSFVQMLQLISGAEYFQFPVSLIDYLILVLSKTKISNNDMNTLHTQTLSRRLTKQLLTKLTVITLNGHTDSVRCVAFSPSGAYVASGCEDGTIKLWNCNNQQCMRTVQASRRPITTLTWIETKYKHQPLSALAVGSEDGTIKIWDIINNRGCIKKVVQADDIISSIVWNAPLKCLVWLSNDNYSYGITELKSIETLKTESIKGVKGYWQYSIACSPVKNSPLFAISSDHMIQIGSIDTKKCNKPIIKMYKKDVGDGTNEILCISWNNDGEKIASGVGSGLIKIWDPQDGTCLATGFGHINAVNSITCNYHTYTKKKLHNKNIYENAFASGSLDHTINIWDWSGNCIQTLRGHTNSVNSVCWSPDGKYIASGSADKSVKLWFINPPMLTIEQLAFCVMYYQEDDNYRNIQFKKLYDGLPLSIKSFIKEPQWVQTDKRKRNDDNNNNNNDYNDEEDFDSLKKQKTTHPEDNNNIN